MSNNGDDYTYVFGETVTTPDSNEPCPVAGFRKDTGQRPFVLVDGAWYYPHELTKVVSMTAPEARQQLTKDLNQIWMCLHSGQKSRAKLIAQGAIRRVFQVLGYSVT